MYFACKANKIEVLDFVCLHFVRISALSAFLRTIFYLCWWLMARSKISTGRWRIDFVTWRYTSCVMVSVLWPRREATSFGVAPFSINRVVWVWRNEWVLKPFFCKSCSNDVARTNLPLWRVQTKFRSVRFSIVFSIDLLQEIRKLSGLLSWMT